MYMYKIDIYYVTLLFYLIFVSPVSNKCSLVCFIYVQSRTLMARMLGGSKGSEEEEEDIRRGGMNHRMGAEEVAKGRPRARRGHFLQCTPSDADGAQPGWSANQLPSLYHSGGGGSGSRRGRTPLRGYN
jgi:hypothetical protein